MSPLSDAKAAGEGEDDKQGSVAAAFWQGIELAPEDNQAMFSRS